MECGLHLTKIENISVKIENQDILRNVSFDIHCNELTMIIGRNGAGKSTLLKAMLGEIAHSGQIEFYDMKKSKKEDIKIGYVPQSLNLERDMPTTVFDMFASYISNKPVWIKKDKNIYNKILQSLKKFGAEKLIDKRVGNLSGGELQRVLLSIAITPLPNLLILDEPVSGIDINGTKEFYQILTKLKQEYDMSIVLVSHDLGLVKKFADRVILIDKEVKCNGTPEEVFKNQEFISRFGEI